MLFMKKAAAAAVLAMGLSAGAQAAVQTFVFEGTYEYFNPEIAAQFGVVDGVTSSFSARLDFDTAQTPENAYYVQYASTFTYASYGVAAAVVQFGNQTVIANSVWLGIHDGINGDYISLVVAGPTFSNGIDFFTIGVETGISPADFLDGADASNILKFNQAIGSYAFIFGGAAENYPAGNKHYVTMSLAPAVPEPATWLTLITGFGLAGVAVRRRRVAFAAQ
ncbi:PEPxxWA-CTERM sorting domain-containing protein [Gimibacter soli]|uniref:PEPxxWA-CTERM sorting domain-containing protein n=1 Tax=Gimibacter soli TaxID=3024400 RepID=A0AAF0BM14_9PROT|nr:PEPxxWA-CTERM sorting domain-containing protein [Gimibacter soli]WCL54015.1 PEPxxWA-CTERM sorting domain-containing protein [Gimibacter soli]